MSEPAAIAVHGGAGRPSGATLRDPSAHHAALAAAVEAGYAILDSGGGALDAVQAAVVELESCPLFNAGVGSVLTSAGTVEMDAVVACGATRRAGAVAAVSGIAHPAEAARAVLDDGRHVLLAGPGAEAFAREHGVATASPESFVTPRQREAWRRRRRDEPVGDGLGTVGAVARDGAGHLAAATSTGGVAAQLPGRVGDSPILGAGTWADDATCAVSTTGAGEAILQTAAAHEVVALVAHTGLTLAEACARVVDELGASGAEAGLIAIGPSGEPVLTLNTPAMHRGWRVGGDEAQTRVGA